MVATKLAENSTEMISAQQPVSTIEVPSVKMVEGAESCPCYHLCTIDVAINGQLLPNMQGRYDTHGSRRPSKDDPIRHFSFCSYSLESLLKSAFEPGEYRFIYESVCDCSGYREEGITFLVHVGHENGLVAWGYPAWLYQDFSAGTAWQSVAEAGDGHSWHRLVFDHEQYAEAIMSASNQLFEEWDRFEQTTKDTPVTSKDQTIWESLLTVLQSQPWRASNGRGAELLNLMNRPIPKLMPANNPKIWGACQLIDLFDEYVWRPLDWKEDNSAGRSSIAVRGSGSKGIRQSLQSSDHE